LERKPDVPAGDGWVLVVMVTGTVKSGRSTPEWESARETAGLIDKKRLRDGIESIGKHQRDPRPERKDCWGG